MNETDFDDEATKEAEAIEEMVADGDYEGLSALLEQQPEIVDRVFDMESTLLQWVCHHKQVSLLNLVLRYKPDVNKVGRHGWTPLHWAIDDGDANSVLLVNMLLDAGADPTMRDAVGRTPADMAKIYLTKGLKEVLALLKMSKR